MAYICILQFALPGMYLRDCMCGIQITDVCIMTRLRSVRRRKRWQLMDFHGLVLGRGMVRVSNGKVKWVEIQSPITDWYHCYPEISLRSLLKTMSFAFKMMSFVFKNDEFWLLVRTRPTHDKATRWIYASTSPRARSRCTGTVTTNDFCVFSLCIKCFTYTTLPPHRNWQHTLVVSTDQLLGIIVGPSVSKNDEFCILKEKSCFKNKEFCIKNDELCRRATRMQQSSMENSYLWL